MPMSVDICDAGDVVEVETKYTNGYRRASRRDVVMTIKSPSGRMVLYGYDAKLCNLPFCAITDRQVEAVRMFMEQHRE